MLVHDQEPLNFDFYQNLDPNELQQLIMRINHISDDQLIRLEMIKNLCQKNSDKNLATIYFIEDHMLISDSMILTHSEKNSQEVIKYQGLGFEPVYWWSHAIISRDWYRYAKVDKSLDYQVDKFEKDFNIYARAWSGSREYRLKFLDMLIDADLVLSSNIKFSNYCQNTHYRNHQFDDTQFVPVNDLDYLPTNFSSSDSSASYDSDDYSRCGIDVVLETIFDDTRHHLTEKTLRPIACGKPFILVSSPGVLEYLRSYGFETFGHLIDESYDTIQDPVQRLKKVIEAMDSIKKSQNKKDLFIKMHEVAQRNKELFWSEDFSKNVLDEFFTNFTQADQRCRQNFKGRKFMESRKFLYNVGSRRVHARLTKDNVARTRQEIAKLIYSIRHH